MKLAYFGNDSLRQKSVPVENFNSNLSAFVDQLIETMIENDGCGIAAPQVSKNIRLFIMHINQYAAPKIIINPKIEWLSEKMIVMVEGCISLPFDSSFKIERPESVEITYQDLNGEFLTEKFSGYEARCILHENDHLEGVLAVDYLSDANRVITEKKIIKAVKDILF
jgi:peptide deformylase